MTEYNLFSDFALFVSKYFIGEYYCNCFNKKMQHSCGVTHSVALSY